jgi:hypothetical protein
MAETQARKACVLEEKESAEDHVEKNRGHIVTITATDTLVMRLCVSCESYWSAREVMTEG